jgi:hypothetical protein
MEPIDSQSFREIDLATDPYHLAVRAQHVYTFTVWSMTIGRAIIGCTLHCGLWGYGPGARLVH